MLPDVGLTPTFSRAKPTTAPIAATLHRRLHRIRPPPDWLDVSGTLSGDGKFLVTCVPPESGLTKTQYKYKVTVSWPGVAPADTLGYLDPRADVIIDAN
jgi:hypothetical protein